MVEATTASEWEGDQTIISATPKASSHPRNQGQKNFSPRRSPRHARLGEIPASLILPRRSPRHAKSLNAHLNVSKPIINEPSSSRSNEHLLTKRKLMFRDDPGNYNVY